MTTEELFLFIKNNCQQEVVLLAETTPPTFLIDAADLVPLCAVLHGNESTYFDMLSCIIGVDNGPIENTMEVIYHLYTIPFNVFIGLKVKLSRQDPVIPSVTSIWKAADWYEREVFDLFGIAFTDHPDLRRILLPADWEGHPLRKDYKHQDYYRDIKVEY